MNEKIISKLKKETNNSTYIIYREKYIKDTLILFKLLFLAYI